MNYKVTLNTVGLKYEAEAATVDEALAKIGLKWNQIKAKGLITVSRGKNSIEHLFYLVPLRRIFANKLTRMMWAKRLQLLFDNKFSK